MASKLTVTVVSFQPAVLDAGRALSVVTGGGGITFSVTGMLSGVLSAPDAVTITWPT